MALDKTRLVDELSNATVIEIADLVKELESKWGVSAAAPVAMAAAGGGGAAAAPAAEAKTTFDVDQGIYPSDAATAIVSGEHRRPASDAGGAHEVGMTLEAVSVR